MMALQGATDEQVALLLSSRVAHLATVDAAGRPHVVPICFALVEQNIYTPLDDKPKRVAPSRLQRVRNLLASPYVCLLVDHYDEDWQSLAWLQVRGVAELVQSGIEEHARAVTSLRDRYPQYRAMAIDRRPLIRLRPERVVAWSAGA